MFSGGNVYAQKISAEGKTVWERKEYFSVTPGVNLTVSAILR